MPKRTPSASDAVPELAIDVAPHLRHERAGQALGCSARLDVAGFRRAIEEAAWEEESCFWS